MTQSPNAEHGMMERLARAFHRGQFSDDEDENVIAEKWREWSFDHERYARRVRIILETLKTPSKGMIEAGDNYLYPDMGAESVFRVMIDHILSETQEG